jgi:diaminohydroxyphosphoribosylaminopyrimidine deaminase/5-amino-6-(5-phosphoribosylamino)uracil reductase
MVAACGRCAELQGPCTDINEAFNHAVVSRRAFVVAKLAQSLDGCVATASGTSQWITQAPARRAGHALRNGLDAILVGSGTVLADDPQLTCRMRGGRDPLRVVLDGRARTPPTARVVTVAKTSKAPTLICVAAAAPKGRRRALALAGAEVWECPTLAGALDVTAVTEHLFARGLLSVLVEGGPQVQGAFFDAHLVDRVEAFIAPTIVGGVGARHAVGGRGWELLVVPHLLRPSWNKIGNDWAVSGRVAYGPSREP